jgi:predicted DNA-binding transcriptional regulator AlpA
MEIELAYPKEAPEWARRMEQKLDRFMQMITPAPDRALGIDAIAAGFGVSTKTVYGWLREEGFPATLTPHKERHRTYRESQIVAWGESRGKTFNPASALSGWR